jgi:acyl carrier protein
MNTYDKQDIYNQVAAVIAETLTVPLHDIKPETKLESLGADSLDMLEIIMKLEELFDVQINDEEAAQISTIQEAVDKIYEIKSAKK